MATGGGGGGSFMKNYGGMFMGGISTLAGAALGGKDSKQRMSRVPSIVPDWQTKKIAGEYGDVVSNYLKSKPGLSGMDINRMMEAAGRRGSAGLRGAQMRTKSFLAQRGIRGTQAATALAYNEQAKMEADYDARINLLLNEHAIRESDIARRAAVGAGYLWPAEQARGAGSVNAVVQNDPNKYLNAIGMGTAAYGAWVSEQENKSMQALYAAMMGMGGGGSFQLPSTSTAEATAQFQARHNRGEGPVKY